MSDRPGKTEVRLRAAEEPAMRPEHSAGRLFRILLIPGNGYRQNHFVLYSRGTKV